MTLTYHKREGWIVDCPEYGGDGYTLSAPERDTGWCDDVRCDVCDGRGFNEAEPDHFDGGTFMLGDVMIVAYSNGEELSDSDGEQPVNMHDLRPFVGELAA